jgi:asparagine synthase (glutamine-hydrolysing)
MDDPSPITRHFRRTCWRREAAKELKVVLTGEGGDELFAGYGRYRRRLAFAVSRGDAPCAMRGFLEGFGVMRDTTRSLA